MIFAPGIKAVIFDLYGTLLLYNDIKTANIDWIDSFHSFINEKVKVTREELIPMCREILTNDIKKDNLLGLTTYETKIKCGLNSIGVNFSISEIEELADYSVSTWQKHISLVRDAKDVLSKLRNNYRLALITNFDHSKHIYRVLDENQLAGFFEEIIISDEVEVNKPDPAIFNHTLNKMNLQSYEAAFVGDSLNDDISGALNVGLLPIFITQEEYNVNHEFESDTSTHSVLSKHKDKIVFIKSLSDLLEMESIKEK